MLLLPHKKAAGKNFLRLFLLCFFRLVSNDGGVQLQPDVCGSDGDV